MKHLHQLLAQRSMLEQELDQIKYDLHEKEVEIAKAVAEKIKQAAGDKQMLFKMVKTTDTPKFYGSWINGLRVTSTGGVQVSCCREMERQEGDRYFYINNWMPWFTRVTTTQLVWLLESAKDITIVEREEKQDNVVIPL